MRILSVPFPAWETVFSAEAAAAAFNGLGSAAVRDGVPDYLPLMPERAASLFLPDSPFPDPAAAGVDRVKRAVFALSGDGSIAGLACGNASPASETAYVTVLLTDRHDAEGEEIRRELLDALTGDLRAVNPGLKRVSWIFYNPTLVPWRLPESFSGACQTRPTHPGAPGVAETDPARKTLLEAGWREFAPLCAYCRTLADYEVPEPLRLRTEENAARGLFVEEYDPALHASFGPLLYALGCEDWRRTVLGNAEKEKPLPVMIAADRSPEALAENGGKGFVCGFAGPMKRAEDGRGYFAGIGIHPAYRSRGLGSTLFAGLCRGLKALGADYMTLFTGVGGTASRIYEKAGFIPACRFAGMEKELS